MKKFTSLFIATAMMSLVGCSADLNGDTTNIGVVTDLYGVDDKSFSEITWKGVSEFAEEHEGVESQYITPQDGELPTLVGAVDNLVMAGNEVVVLTGFTFEETAGVVAQQYPNVDFILIDGQPMVDGEYKSFDNVKSIYFQEHEASFLAGIASALETKTGKLGFIGGMEVDAVKKFGHGYVAGVAYANEHLGTDAQVVDYLYSGSFSDVAMGQALAGGMFDKGVDTILHAAGGVGVGAIAEAKTRGDVKMVGVDVDQYHEGLLDNGDSVMLTSAMKNIDVAVKDTLEDYINGEFVGGEVVTLGITQNGVGLPQENPNLSQDTINVVNEVSTKVKNGEVVVPSTKEELETFLVENNYHVEGVTY